MAEQFCSTKELEKVVWVLPTAPENMDMMTTAWYRQTKLTVRPNPRPELDDDEDEDGMLQSSAYILSLVDDLVSQGVPLKRIFLAGFSQGCAISLLTGLTSKYAGEFAGIIGLMGYMPLAGRLDDLKQRDANDQDITKQPVFLARGKQDQLVPSRYFQLCSEKLQAFNVKEIVTKEYDVGHSLSPTVLSNIFEFLVSTLHGTKT